MARRLTSCCCCCGLAKGAVCIGVIYLLANCAGVLLLALTLTGPPILRIEASGELSDEKEKEEAVQRVEHFIMVVEIMMLALMAIGIPWDILLLVGARRKQRYLLLPWIVWYSLLAILLVIWALYLMVTLLMTGDKSVVVWVYSAACLVVAAVTCYAVALVGSFHQQLKEEGGRGGYTMHPTTEG
ncbi:uncharacterized protein LOC119114357 [Pollicipes pollicipes]|uniref:uncharacterized protein LOC119114357 n=1 Tax=Pollicipes pollicipes TaxID=41117 RepID=UPI00188527A3|nr:uncharacterized protein LOC119114357 [Pollicipes pollicipes]